MSRESVTSRLLSLWVSSDFRALLHVVAARKGLTLSGYVRRAVWDRLKREATPNEMREYKSTAWKMSR